MTQRYFDIITAITDVDNVKKSNLQIDGHTATPVIISTENGCMIRCPRSGKMHQKVSYDLLQTVEL